MSHKESESIKKVRQYALKKFTEILDGSYELPKYQSMDDIETDYISQDTDTKDFVDQGMFGILEIEENDLLQLLEPIELFSEKLQKAKAKFSESNQIDELMKILEIIEEKIDQLKKSLNP